MMTWTLVPLRGCPWQPPEGWMSFLEHTFLITRWTASKHHSKLWESLLTLPPMRAAFEWSKKKNNYFIFYFWNLLKMIILFSFLFLNLLIYFTYVILWGLIQHLLIIGTEWILNWYMIRIYFNNYSLRWSWFFFW